MEPLFEVKPFEELSGEEVYEIMRTRQEIFVIEQNCPYEDMDGIDKESIHVFYRGEDGRVEACLRVYWRDAQQGIAQIGRVVTLQHGQGLGGPLLKEGVQVALEQFQPHSIFLEAQTYAIGYYEKEGFRVVSEEFLEDGIPHVAMERICIA